MKLESALRDDVLQASCTSEYPITHRVQLLKSLSIIGTICLL